MSMPAAILACLAAHLTRSAAFVPLPIFTSRSESRRSANFAERSLAFPFPASSRSHDLGVLMSATRPESYDIRGLVELDPKSKKVLNTDASASGLAGAPPKITSPKFDDVCEFTGVTLSRFMSAVSRENPELRDLETLISGIQQSVKTIAKLVERGGNWGPEEHKQKQLVNVANDILRKTLAATGTVGTISAHSSQFSQQEEFPLMVDSVSNNEGSKYVAVFDPLDGVRNAYANAPTGTIFGIYKTSKESLEKCTISDDWIEACSLDNADSDSCSTRRIGSADSVRLANILQPGTSLVASGYCIYSSSCVFVMTFGAGTHGFTFNRANGEFVLTHPDIQIPQRGKITSFNQARQWEWANPVQEYLTAIETGQGETKELYTQRYIGSMVGDVHRTLIYGGIFGCPADHEHPNGKLRLVYEAAPMSFLIEQAGGLSLDGRSRVMQRVPLSMKDTTPFFAGSALDVLELKSYYDADAEETTTSPSNHIQKYVWESAEGWRGKAV